MTQHIRSRLAGLIGGSAAGTPFALVAASHGEAGLVTGAVVVVITTLIGADGLFWPLVLLVHNRQQRWAWRKTGSVKDALRLDAPARRTLEKTVQARLEASRDNNTRTTRRRSRSSGRG
ncbi:hypothetical protein P8605_02005 [Streptomyces sp. T-3]|nr:hypothetical protein [Streptomyces sp. T-3]